MVHWKNASTLDDTLDVFPCHGVGGMVGMLMTGVFAKDVGLTSGHATTFLVHCGALVFVAAFSFCGSWLLYKVTDFIIPLRVSERAGRDRPRPQPARRSDAGRDGDAAAADVREERLSLPAIAEHVAKGGAWSRGAFANGIAKGMPVPIAATAVQILGTAAEPRF